MGFIQTPQKKRIKIRLPDTQRLREVRRQHKEWLESKGLSKIRPRQDRGTLEFPKIEDRTGVPCGNRPPIAVKGRQEAQQYSGERRLVGIATMHKSNQVPVFADDDDTSGRKAATEITLMKGNK